MTHFTHPRTLDKVPPGTEAVIQEVGGLPEGSRRLMELGLVPGTRVQVIRRAPLGDPLEIRVRGTHLSLRLSEAAEVYVSPA
ncbi:MAG: FeoA family protein [Gemmatimonadota bacterium]|jgi:ferrous iron transport protein A|nr:ferrous iron transport protein A [Gemmatimonadota bacterium]MDP6528400.1 FeoA family protein [Gemmatimonadota bacterium]MDP6802549.1 FeoA family protein [Gemmatimonadota bacterium]MDP7031812.1 FeoA family protein [Gemmatimonadota bacterium]